MRRFPWLRALLAAGTLLVLVAFFATVRRNLDEMRTLRAENGLIARTVEVQRELATIRLAAAESDSALRGYILTRGEGLVEQFDAAQRRVSEGLARLETLTADNPVQAARVAPLRAATERLRDELATVMAHRRQGTIDDALAQARAVALRELRREILDLTTAMDVEESRQLDSRRARAEAAYAAAVRGRLGSGIVSAALLLAIAGSSILHARSRALREQALIASERRAREAAEREQDARAEAERANAQKDQFLAILSHELRTPLNAVLGWTQILQATGPKDPALDRALASIRRNAEAQQRLVEDLLDVSRIIAGKLPMDKRPFDLRSAVAAAVEAVRPSAAGKGIAVQARLDDAGIVDGDPLRLQQVASNLLTNAVKFTPTGGRVSVSLARQDGNAVLEVRDSGVGLSPEFAPHVFERFSQGDGSTTRAHGGLGLGLAIAKHIVDTHGGTIEVESDGPDTGAVFRVRLPTA